MYAKKIREFSDDRLLSEKLPIFFKNRKMNNLCRKLEFLSNIVESTINPSKIVDDYVKM